MTGVSAIQYFSVTIFNQIGIDSDSALKYQAINNILALIAQASCILFIDRLGRRWPLILGNLTNSLMFLIATVLIGELSLFYVCALQKELTDSSSIPTRNQPKWRSRLGFYHCSMSGPLTRSSMS